MPQDANHLVWIDMEMTGLDPDRDRIIEIAIVVTDSQLATVAEAPVLVVHQPDAVLDAMDEWNKSTHRKSGLVDRVRASRADEADGGGRGCSPSSPSYVPPKASPMCGNSICQDRRFLARWMPRLEALLPLPQPRRLDAEGARAPLAAGARARRWRSRASTRRSPTSTSRSRSCRYYRENFLRLES